MTGRDAQLETLARTTDLLLGHLEPTTLVRRFLDHVVDAFGAAGGLVHFAHTPEPLLEMYEVPGPEARDLAAGALDELRTGGRLHDRWPGSALRGAPRGWAQITAVRPGWEEREAVLVLGFAAGRHPEPGGDRLLHLMVRNAALAVDNAFLHLQTRRQAEQLAVQADELERVRRALEGHSREIERSMAARNRFFAIMNHELRTPINAIMGYGQLLAQGAFGRLEPAQADAAARIGATADQLLTLVDDVLDFSKIDAGKVEVRWRTVVLPEIVAEAAASVEANARLKGLRLRVECKPHLPAIRTDPDRVRQILLNLLANAIKFTPSGSVDVTVGPATDAEVPDGARPGAESWIAVQVRDTGIGIPPDQIELVFGEFVQLPGGHAASARGSGLGLAISSRLARLLGGRLTAVSELGVASTFTLLLPCPGPRVESAPSYS